MARNVFRAPAEDGGLLAVPPLSEAPARLAANREALASWDYDFQGRRSARLRSMVRSQVLAKARAYLERAGIDPGEAPDPDVPLVVTGHQAELFHPGVWVKNFAVADIARRCGGTALNLIVDNDTPKSSAIRVPHAVEGRLRMTSVDFDEYAGEVPYEDLKVRDETVFASFGDRVRETLGGQVADPLIDDFWPLATGAAASRIPQVGMRFAVARRALEGSWGVRNLEVPLSALCETEGFLWFASHLLAQLPRFQEVHNAALARYRAEHGIRSRHHPVPALAKDGDWLEAPFWVWRARSPRRRPLLARQLERTVQLRIADEAEPFIEIPLGPDRDACCAVRDLQILPSQGIRLRTRALTTTMFARFLLGDIFLHGIGGAKYDELGDEVARGFFGVEPPPFLTLSMTLRLGLTSDAGTPERLKALEHELRDLTFNPDRHLAPEAAAELRGWVEAKRLAIAGPQDSHAQRRARFAEIRRYNEAMQGAVAGRRSELLEERTRLTQGLRHNTIARNREYSLVLHSRSRLRAAMNRAVPGLLGEATRAR